MTYIGIDPGKKGAVAVIHEDGEVEVCPMENVMLSLILKALSKIPTRCCLEKVHAMPGQGVTSMFNFGVSYGYLKGLLDAYNISYQEIPPERWKKEFGLNTDKTRSVEVCHQLFPATNLKASERCRVDSDGMAEALLMAEYARRKL